MDIEAIVVPRGSVFLATRENLKGAQAREIGFLWSEEGELSKEEFKFLLSRLRGYKRPKVLLIEGSVEAGWFTELFEK